MRLGRTAITIGIICLLLLSTGCISSDDEVTPKVKIELMGESEQNVVQGNNTTFIFAIENNWKENATLVMGIKDIPKDWSVDFLNDSAVLGKNEGAGIFMNVSVPPDAKEQGHRLRVKVKGQGSDVHRASEVVTVFVLDSALSPELDVVSPGDTVYVNYTGFLLSGSVFDTTNEDIAEDFRIDRIDEFQGRTAYEPAPFHPARGELVKGFDDGFANMRKGETRSFYVDEDDAYSIHEEVTINLTESVPMKEEWTTNEFGRAFRQDPAMWLTVTHRKWGWDAQVVAIADDELETVTLELQVSPGDTIEAYGWETEVISVDSSANDGEGEIVLLHKPAMDSPAQLYNSTAPKEFDYGEVTEITDETVTIYLQRSHHGLAGFDLIFVVKIHEFQQ
jgi:FKBP-type peptidyl-prolyl cis-trans isomerase 2